MSNKINISHENSPEARIPVSTERRKGFGRRALEVTGLFAGGALLALVGNEVIASQQATPEGSETYTIQPGDTLNEIAAEQVDNGADNVNDTVDAIRDMNDGLEPGNLPVGTEIEIPDEMNE